MDVTIFIERNFVSKTCGHVDGNQRCSRWTISSSDRKVTSGFIYSLGSDSSDLRGKGLIIKNQPLILISA